MKTRSRKTDLQSSARIERAEPLEGALGDALAATSRSAPSRDLQVFPNPARSRDYVIQFLVPEFTCNCPLTGQPDFAHFTIEMVADKVCIELKSLKLYFWSYRNVGAFHEKVTNAIVDDLVAAADPRFIRITAKWNVRGGIYTNLVVEHRKKGWKPQTPVELPPQSGSVASY
jgi:7-cyano-7-deazaguanine reductase